MKRAIGIACVICFSLAVFAGRSVAFEIDARSGEIAIKTLAGFDKCVLDLSEIPACLQALQRHTDKHPNDAFQAAKRALMHYQAWTALPMFEIAFRKRATDAQCEDDDVFRAVSAGLSQPATDLVSLQLARTIAADKCWEALQERLIEALGEGNSAFKVNTCPLLASKSVTAPACIEAAARMKRAIGLPATTAREQSPPSRRHGRGFCSVLTAHAAAMSSMWVHVSGRRSSAAVSYFRGPRHADGKPARA
jgi:hypothetical protein